MSGRPRARQLAATPVARYTVLVFLLAAAMIVAVAVTLDRNARHSSWQEHTTALAGGARVGASSFESLRANLRVQATQLATSLPLQRAVVTGNEAELRRIADARHARIDLHGRSIGALAGTPRISSSAKITDGLRVLATVTIALPLGDEVLTLLRQATPLPTHGGLVLVRDGRVIAGGPKGAAGAASAAVASTCAGRRSPPRRRRFGPQARRSSRSSPSRRSTRSRSATGASSSSRPPSRSYSPPRSRTGSPGRWPR